jgi:hypothetical protein
MPMEARPHSVAMRFEWVVPPDVSVVEPYPGDVTTTGPTPNPRLEALRSALETDSRWVAHQVAPRKDPDTDHWRVIVWVIIDEDNDEAVDAAREAVPQLVDELIPGASLVGFEFSGL